MQKIHIIGRLGRDPEIRQAGDAQVASFPVAVTEKWKDRNGNKQERTEWFACVAWRGLASVVQAYVHKGDQIAISGKISTRTWEKDGQKHHRAELIVDDLELLGGGKSERVESNQDQGGYPDDSLPF